MATLATATEKKIQAGPDEKSDRKPQRTRVDDKFKIFSGSANERLADDVCEFLGLTRNQALVTRFKDGEAYVQIQENVRGAEDVYKRQRGLRSGVWADAMIVRLQHLGPEPLLSLIHI